MEDEGRSFLEQQFGEFATLEIVETYIKNHLIGYFKRSDYEIREVKVVG